MHRVDWSTGALSGPDVRESRKTLGELKDLFADRSAGSQLPAATILYTVQWWPADKEGAEGGLFWGTTTIEPGPRLWLSS